MTNPIRGEVSVIIGDVEVILVADMNRLAQLSAATGRPTFEDLYQRLAGSEAHTTMEAVRIFTVRGKQGDKSLDYLKTLEAISPNLDVGAMLRLRSPMTELLSALIKPASNRPDGDAMGNASGAQSQ